MTEWQSLMHLLRNHWRDFIRVRVAVCVVFFLPLYLLSNATGNACDWINKRCRRFELFCERDLPRWARGRQEAKQPCTKP
jgi:hypothetical protein